MQVKTGARIASVLIVTIFTAIIAANAAGLLLARQARSQAATVQDIRSAVLDLNVLATEIQNRQNERITRQFEARIALLVESLAKLEVDPVNEGIVIRRLLSSAETMRLTFHELGRLHTDSGPVDDERARTTLMRTFLGASHTLASLSNRLSNEIAMRIEAIESTVLYLNIISGGVVLLMALVLYTSILTFIVGPIVRLREGIQRIAPSAGSAGNSVNSSANELVEIAAELDRRLSALRRAEEQAAAYARDLERSNADLEQFAYVASHDLRAPLRGIKTTAGWIAEDMADRLDPESRENLTLLQSRVERLDKLLEGLLQYSRSTTKRYENADIALSELLEDIALVLQPPPGMRIEVPPYLPRLRTAVAPLQQVLQNLIENAMKHHDRPEGCIRVSVEDLEDRIQFEVRDDGPGIPRQFHVKVTQIFQTLKRRDEKEASGLGLALVKKIVERYGGGLEIDSPLTDRGCAIRFFWLKEPSSDAAV